VQLCSNTCGAVSNLFSKNLARTTGNKKGTEVPFFIVPNINAKLAELRRRYD
jgi:hypothetical protein